MRILVTCALPYVNNVPHIGNIAGSHLPADIFARFCRLAGYETVFIGGSDEHGTPTEVAAEQLGVEPKELCDKYYEIHREIYAWMDISYDNFSRTSRREHHKTTKEFFKKIYSNGFISEGRLMLPYCKKCSRFLPDRYIEGTCPVCGYESARGDQCEKCSNMLNPDELEKARCTICGSSPRAIETKHLFLNLDKLEPRLEKWIKGKRALWSSQVVKMALGWINEGLKPRCITRDIKWGVKVPLEGYEDKVFYVWFDAPIGYISSTKEWADKTGMPGYRKKFWQGKETKIFHFIGKDNIPFHTIFWPGMLMANGDYSLPYRVAGLQYLNYEGHKISKSKGWGVFCENLPNAGLDSDIWRFYLTLLIPEIDDTEWKWAEFQERVNNELVANLGNFIYRTLSFIWNSFDGKIPGGLGKREREIAERSAKYASETKELLWDIRLRDALKKVLAISDLGNKYFQENEPWKAVKTDLKKAEKTMLTCANLCYDIAILLAPFMPKSSEKIFAQLGTPPGGLKDIGKNKIKPGQKIKKPVPLFPKLSNDDIERLREITSRVTEDIFGSKIVLKTARVIDAENIQGSDKLLKLGVDVGGVKKQIVAGIAEHYKPGELVGRTVVIVDNLEHVVIRGEKSEGMLLVAGEGKKISLVTPDRESRSGIQIQ